MKREHWCAHCHEDATALEATIVDMAEDFKIANAKLRAEVERHTDRDTQRQDYIEGLVRQRDELQEQLTIVNRERNDCLRAAIKGG